VTVVSEADIAATGAVSAEDLFRTVPQAGDITFNGTYLGGGNSNAARGDISTVSLRGLAQGNTLMLLNGRRSVLHPTSQTDNQTPVFGYNVNAVPVAGLARVEVLKDGAAALYGSARSPASSITSCRTISRA
jgi:outer membrane receptor for ferrienterochelin and colicin